MQSYLNLGTELVKEPFLHQPSGCRHRKDQCCPARDRGFDVSAAGQRPTPGVQGVADDALGAIHLEERVVHSHLAEVPVQVELGAFFPTHTLYSASSPPRLWRLEDQDPPVGGRRVFVHLRGGKSLAGPGLAEGGISTKTWAEKQDDHPPFGLVVYAKAPDL